MCGIAGILDLQTSPPDREAGVARMCAAMVHRGPDDEGSASVGPVTLGMRRLAIFDPANGRQPMRSPDGRFTLIFNGAIYNFRTLRADLAGSHWEFRTQCDTEVLLAAFVRWGADCLRRLRGMFAFAVWDQQEQSLFLARDPFGIKPLYYRHEGGRLLFASELNALLASGLVPVGFDPLAVSDYLAWLAVPAPRTIYRDIFSLPPGHSATLRGGRLELRPAWSFATIPTDQPVCRTRAEFIAELRVRLEDTVRAHVVADVPVGAFLSGGLDSAAVVGLMSRANPGRLRTFSIDFQEPGFSEATAAAETARHFGTEHHARLLGGAEVARDVGKIIRALDQPTGDGINTYYASEAARAGGVTVALSGLGGDELFGGYPSFRDTPRLARWLRVWRALPSVVRDRAIARLQRGDTRRRKLADVLAHARSLQEVCALQRRVFSAPASGALLAPDLAAHAAAAGPFHPALASLAIDLAGTPAFDAISAWELRTYMADVLLRDSDVMSMRHSLELRVPFVDRPLVEWLWRQPARFKTDPRQPKTALAEALRDVLPPRTASRPKQGFSLPFDSWMKRDLKPFLDETFSDASLGRSGLFNAREAQRLWRGFLDHQDSREWSRVWSLAVLVAFANRPSPARAERASVPVIASRPPFEPAEAASRPAARTLLLAPEIFASEGGIPRILQTYLQALAELGGARDSVRLLALNDRAFAPADLTRFGAGRIEQSTACGRSKLRFVREALRLSRGSDRLICGHLFQLPVAWLARRFNPRLRYYLVAHGIEVWRPFSPAECLALRGAERIFCVSEFTRREVLRHCPIPEHRLVVLHNALDPAFPIAAGRPLAQCAPVILTVARLTYADRYKGVEHLIEAMPAIRAALPQAHLRIVGRGDDRPRLEAIRDRLGLGDAVTFVGYVDDDALTAEIQACRLFALPSRKEGFGLVFLEAMASGRPCLGANAGGVPEVISADTGVLVEYGDVAGIARAGIAALERPWDETAILARAHHFSYPPFKDRLAALLAA